MSDTQPDPCATTDEQRAAPDRERVALSRVWRAFGCDPNPDDFKPSERDVMWVQIEEFAREALSRDTRTARENRELWEDLAAERDRADRAEARIMAGPHYGDCSAHWRRGSCTCWKSGATA